MKTTEEMRGALVRAAWFTQEEADALSERMVDHYYDILYHGTNGDN